DRNRSHWSTSKTPSYTKSVSWQHHLHVAGWVSLFTLHVIWPFLWIWATLYRPERGWGMQSHDSSVMQLQQRIAGLEKQLADIKSSSAE
ncbi:DUF3302 domain-containing protein, partial [Escherichia coli]|nr:DUF3302 domain-containing protein [Escherichia coli]